MSLRTRWSLYFGGSGTLLIALLGALFYASARDVLIDRSWRQLESVRSIKQQAIESQFRVTERELRRIASEAAPTPRRCLDEHSVPGSRAVLVCPDEALPDSVPADLAATNLPPDAIEWTDYYGTGAEARRFLILRHRGTLWVAVIGPESLAPILNQREGLGLSGESYLLGADGRLRSDSRFYAHSTLGQIRTAHPLLRSSLAGKASIGLVRDYRGISVLSASAPIRVGGLQWAIFSEIDYEEVMAPLLALRRRMLLLGTAGVLLFALLAGLTAHRMAAPARRIRDHLVTLARGAFPDAPLVSKRRDEFGAMVQALHQLEVNLKNSVDFARQIGQANLDAQHTPLGPDDLLGHALIEMRDNLARARQQLEALNRLRLREAEVRSRLRRQALVEGQEQERRRLARELHDSVGQLMTALKFALAALPLAAEQRQGVVALADETARELRRISGSLMPGVLMDFGLEAALRQLANQTQQATGIAVLLVGQLAGYRPPSEVETALYRVAQEAIQNALKHGPPSRIDLRLSHQEEQLSLEIADNGRGFEPQAVPERSTGGLAHMRERVELLGGQFTLVSEVGQGAYIRATVPVRQITEALPRP